jgi:hypothetical protein
MRIKDIKQFVKEFILVQNVVQTIVSNPYSLSDCFRTRHQTDCRLCGQTIQ